MEFEQLRKQALIGQFAMTTGCDSQQALGYLEQSQWHYEIAISAFYETFVPQDGSLGVPHSMAAPANTPATPPMFPDALLLMSSMSMGSPHQQHQPPSTTQQQQQQQQSQQQQQQQQQQQSHNEYHSMDDDCAAQEDLPDVHIDGDNEFLFGSPQY